MQNIEISRATPAEIAELFVELSNEEIRLATQQLNLEQLAAVLLHMNEKNTPYWKGKTRAILLGLSSQEQLEMAGRFLSSQQILDFLESDLIMQDDNFTKLLSILVGMPHQTFSQLLCEISDEQLQLLLQAAYSEPLQHQLTVFIHEMNNRYLILSEELQKILKEIEHLSIDHIGKNELILIKNKINDISLEFSNSLEKMRSALKIAWNTHRTDLIENLNEIKDKYLHTLNQFIGHPETSQGTTGLFELLNQQINTVFGNPYDLNDPESLSNGEPAIEALVKFSIWYLRDYWEIGLLPQIQNESELELDPATSTEQERLEHRDQLFSKVQSNLEKLHLKTLWDLKKAHIYSKKALSEYIKEKKSLIER